ncbi:hypothetical protein EBR57_02655 [bacterium]|nr:hypothetical protein [bacterium]
MRFVISRAGSNLKGSPKGPIETKAKIAKTAQFPQTGRTGRTVEQRGVNSFRTTSPYEMLVQTTLPNRFEPTFSYRLIAEKNFIFFTDTVF